MMLQAILDAKLATAKAEVAKIEADMAALANSGWLAHEEAQIKAWIESAKSHLGL